MNDFVVFILSHGRPDNIRTLRSLEKCGYTGPIYIVIDDEDKTKDKYIELFNENILIFNKDEIVKEFDIGTNAIEKKSIIFARNVCFKFANKLGFKYFIQLDDDYDDFSYRFAPDRTYAHKQIKNLDRIFEHMLKYYRNVNVLSIAMAQGGDFIGGKDGDLAKEIKTKRKAMNSFICTTERPFSFVGNINEDVNTYVSLGRMGKIFLTIGVISLNQMQTQKNKGGMTDFYLDKGTYYKSFYSVMYCPSSVVISSMGNKFRRIHHKIKWGYTVPQILNEKYKSIERKRVADV